MQAKQFILLLTISFLGILTAQAQHSESQSQAPYFQVNSTGDVESFPLLGTSAKANIVGSIADVLVQQVYQNRGSEPIEAIYVFPGSTRAAVYGMEAIINGDTIRAKIEEKGKAKAIYTAAVNQGKRAVLLAQSRANVFKMSVGNIMPGDEVKVNLNYTELLVPENNIYQFHYPAVVGPRFTGESEENTSSYTSCPYLTEGQSAPFEYNISATIRAGMSIRNTNSCSHDIEVNYPRLNIAEVKLAEDIVNPGGKDFYLNYQLAGDKIETGLLLYNHGDEKFFTLMMQPPVTVQPAAIPAREFVFIVDVSGSMSGFPLEVSKNLLRDLLTELRPSDRFNIVYFAGASQVWAKESQSATTDNLEKALSFLSNQRGGGGTYLLNALKTSMALPAAKTGEARSFVIISDGYINVEKEAFDYIRQNLNKANFFSFGIGSSPNVLLMEGIAHVGGGEAMIVQNQNEAPKKAEAFRKYISQPVLTKIKMESQGFNIYDLTQEQLPDLLAQRPLIVQGKWTGNPEGKICISGYTGAGAYEQCIDLKEAKLTPANSPIRYHWAREKIRLLDDYRKNGFESAGRKETTALGLKYNLLTAYTSFVAVQENQVTGKKAKPVKQPLPLPTGVTNSAVGFDLAINGVSLPKAKKTAPKVKYQLQSITFNGQALANPLDAETLWLDLFEIVKMLSIMPGEISIQVDAHGQIISIKLDGKNWDNHQAQLLIGQNYSKLTKYGAGVLSIKFK